MVKHIFSNLSRGFFYSIGKVLAIIFIGVVIVFVVNKFFPQKQPINYNVQWVHHLGGGADESYEKN